MIAFATVIVVASYSISQNIREGLLEAFYGVYEKSPDKVKMPIFPDGGPILS
jgi:hypothetical protein